MTIDEDAATADDVAVAIAVAVVWKPGSPFSVLFFDNKITINDVLGPNETVIKKILPVKF